jgi:hypothetical protein
MGEGGEVASWQFRSGNVAARRHGIWSGRIVDPLTAELVAGLLAERPDLQVFPEAVAAWGRAEARCLLLDEYLVREGLFGEDGEAKAARYVAQFERLAADLRRRLGLDPGAEAELAKSRAEVARVVVDLESIRQRGRAVLDTRHAEVGGG